jgi:hypothetical protein
MMRQLGMSLANLGPEVRPVPPLIHAHIEKARPCVMTSGYLSVGIFLSWHI